MVVNNAIILLDYTNSKIDFLWSNLVISQKALVYNFLTKLRLRNSLMEYEIVAGKSFYR